MTYGAAITAARRERPRTTTARTEQRVADMQPPRPASGVRVRRWASAAVVAAIALCAAAAVRSSPATGGGEMVLLNMQRIKSYVDDTCTLDPHCQWTWDRAVDGGLLNVSAKQAAAMVPADYMFPPGDDAEKPGQRGERGFCRKVVRQRNDGTKMEKKKNRKKKLLS